MQTPKRKEMKVSTGYDFNGLNAHVSRCLLRQICKRLSVSTSLNSKFEEGEHAATSSSKISHIQRFYGALIFVDISGFTALSTRLDIESLTTHINGYFKDMLAIIESFGGDVVKFAGDAMYVIWHAKSYNERQKAVLKAVACAKEIVRKCNNRTVPLSPASFDTAETTLKNVALAQSLLSVQSALERDADPNFDSNDDEGSTTIVNCHETSASFISDDLESSESPRSPRVNTQRRRNSLSSRQLKTKTRRLSFPSFSKTAGDSIDSKDPEVASLNVHIGVSVGVLAGIDVSARNRSEFFLTGQPLIDVSDAESLAKLGQIVVSKGVFEFLQQDSDLETNYECVSTELECYRIMEPIILSDRETELRYGPAADVKRELSNILSMNGGLREEQSQRAMLLKCLSTHVHEAARMQSPAFSRCNSPPYISYPGESMSNSIDNNGSCISSVYSSAHSDDSFDLGCKNELSASSSQKFERKLSFDNGILPDDVLSAELRELVVLFIKIDLNVTLSHSAAPSVTAKPEQSTFSPRSSIPHERWDNLTPRGEISGEDFVVDKFGFLERTPADESADVALHGRFQACMTILADTFAEHGGQIGQYSCCEKGNVCLGTFGLRGSVQEDNAAAAIESAQTILVRLQAIGFNASIGVTSGKVYSGLVGSPSRHEYSIMGPAANLSSRLMCAAAIGTILSDGVTRTRDRSHLFLDMPSINAKGYSEPVRTYQPVLSDTFRRRLYSRRGSIDSWSVRNLTDDPDVFGMMAIDKLSASRNPETFLFGRNSELDAITQFLFPREVVETDANGMEPMKIAIVTGACGCGKTTFLASVRDLISKDPFFANDMDSSVDLIFSGGSNSYDTTVPFNSWRPVLTALIAATSKHARSLAKEDKYNSGKMPGRYTCQGLFSPIDTGESGLASFSPMGRFSSDRTISAFSSKATSPIPPASCSSPRMDDGCVNSPSRRDTDTGMTTGPPSVAAHRFSHLRAGCALIIDALTPAVLSNIHLIYKILPSFSKISKSPKPECTLTGAMKLQKTVEVLSSVIQTAVDLIQAKRIFITLDDVQSLDPSSWNLLTHMWRSNTAISVLASFHSLSRSSGRGKVASEGGEIDFKDFKDPSRCLVIPLAPLDKTALSQLVGKMLETSDLSYSQVSIITEAAVDLAGGNPLFAREITISAVETFKDSVQTDVDNSVNSESMEEATLSHVINTLRPRHRIEEIISLRFDRLTPSYQLVLKLATVVAKDGASFNADLISHLMKELSNVSNVASKSSKSKPLRTESLAIVNLNSINVEETLRNILNSNEFIRLAERTSHRLCIPNVQPIGAVKYKFKNILIKKSIYDLMLNHQKLWSHQKVAEYLEAQALVRVAELRSRPVDDSDDELEDVESVSREENSREGESSSRWDYSDCGRSVRGKEFGAIANWNMLGVHWRLSNNLIKAMACFYESGHLVDSQGDIETARLLWTEAYEILCLMRKDSKFPRDVAAPAPSEKALYETANDEVTAPEDFVPMNYGNSFMSLSIKMPSLGLFRKSEEKSFRQERSQHASECIYHVFKGDSLALEVAITLIVRLSQNVLMFEEQPEDVVNLNNEALELVSCTRRTLLERDAVTFIHVPRLSPSLFLKGSCLLGPNVGGGKERRQSITLKDGKKLFCLRDPSMIFPVFSGLCMRYSGDLLPDDTAHKNWSNIVDVYLATARDSKIPVHIIRSLSLKSLLCYCTNDFLGTIETVYIMDKTYVYQNHSEQLIHIYGADRALLQYTFGAISCVILGDFQQAVALVQRTEEYLGSLTHLQSVLTTSMLQFVFYLLLQQYDTAYSNFISLLNFVSFNGGQRNMFHLYLPLYAELGKRLGYTDFVQSSATSPHTGATRRGSTSSLIGSVVSDMDAMADLGTLGEVELESLGYPALFDYNSLLVGSKKLSLDVIDARKYPIPVILALRYGKGIELVSAELCLLEAKRLFLDEFQPHKLKRCSLSMKEEQRNFDLHHTGGSAIWRSVDVSRDSKDSKEECDPVGAAEGRYSEGKGPRGPVLEVESPSCGSAAQEYCEAGLRYLDFSFGYYPLYDSTLNSLQCYIVKADTLVTLQKIQDFKRSKGELPTLSHLRYSDLHMEARQCLCSALELGVTYDFKFSLLLVGIAFVQLGLNVENGKKLLREFMLFLMNLNRSSENVVIDVEVAIDSGEYDWMHSFPILVLARSLLRGI